MRFDRNIQWILLILRSFDLNAGEQSKGKFTHYKDLYFPQGCGSLKLDLLKKSHILKKVSPLSRSISESSTPDDDYYDNVAAAQTLNEQILAAPRSFNNAPVRRTGNRNDGFYYPDYRFLS